MFYVISSEYFFANDFIQIFKVIAALHTFSFSISSESSDNCFLTQMSFFIKMFMSDRVAFSRILTYSSLGSCNERAPLFFISPRDTYTAISDRLN